ncbi:MAG: hypothetical protein JKY61_05560 [Planctomycetes bacterium]|nr:hypothetical protein [Planctomycetota bacterium]
MAILFDEVPTSLIGVFFRAGKLGWKKRRIIQCWWSGWRHGDKTIRVSCAQLIRIRHGNRFLLVPNSRFKQMQPPGGVTKALSHGRAVLDKLGAQIGSDYKVGSKDEADLRVHVPGRNLIRFLGWYGSGEGREASPADREFREELLETEILPVDLFGSPKLQKYRTTITGPRHSKHFGCTELLVQEFFDLDGLETDQVEFLAGLQESKSCGRGVGVNAKFGWYTKEEIESGGRFPDAAKQPWSIGDHAQWMI